MARLTKRHVESLPLREKDYIEWDSTLPGFGIRIWPTDRRVYVVQYRTKTGTSRRKTLGRHGVITAEQARGMAQQTLGQVSLGNDPMAEQRATKAIPTVAQFADRYMREHAEAKKKPNSIRSNEQHLRLHILPRLGRKKLSAVTRSDISTLSYQLREKPSAANHSLALLSHMFHMAEEWGHLPEGSNPVRRVARYKEKQRERFLSREELARLGDTLAECERTRREWPGTIAALRLLMFTGARCSEITTLRWEYVDRERTCLRLPDSKTGAKVIYLPPAALSILSQIERLPDNPYVIVGREPGAHYINLGRVWMRVRKRAELEDVRLHDLRHSFASVSVGLGLSLPIIGKMLGHTDSATTQRYAHLAEAPLREATDLVGGEIARAIMGK